jgi:hypothetical protein
LDFADTESPFSVLSLNVVRELAVALSEIAKVEAEAVDKSDIRSLLIPCAAAWFSEAFDKRRSGVLMSCLETRFGSDVPFETFRPFVAGTVSARLRDALSKGRETILRMIVPGGDGPSSSVSESNAEISSGSSWNGSRGD